MAETQHFGDRRPDEERQLDELLAELRGILDDVALGILDRSTPAGRRWSLTAGQLLTKARQRTRDKSAPPDRTRSSSSAHADPTFGAAVAFGAPDPDLEAWRDFYAHLEAMAGAGTAALVVLDKATPQDRRPDRDRFGRGRCRVCGDVPIYRGRPEDYSERCQWCYRKWSEYGVDMPRRIVAWRKQGKTITPAMIRAELGEELAC